MPLLFMKFHVFQGSIQTGIGVGITRVHMRAGLNRVSMGARLDRFGEEFVN